MPQDYITPPATLENLTSPPPCLPWAESFPLQSSSPPLLIFSAHYFMVKTPTDAFLVRSEPRIPDPTSDAFKHYILHKDRVLLADVVGRPIIIDAVIDFPRRTSSRKSK